MVAAVGPGITQFQAGDSVYGVTNREFTGAHAEFALARANMTARKPQSLSFAQAASAPVVAVTAWQMLFDYGGAAAGQTVLIHGAGGNVGAFAVQMAAQAGLNVIASASAEDEAYLHRLGAGTVIDYRGSRFEEVAHDVDIVLDLVGGETLERSFGVVKPGGKVVSVVSRGAENRAVFFLVEVTTDRLNAITQLFEQGRLIPRVGSVVPLQEARTAHMMLGGAPHKPGKILLAVAELN